MPAPIISGLITFLTQRLGVVVWDGEVPRQDTSGRPINPDATGTTPPDWPVVKLYMKEGGFAREWTFEDPYTDSGEILIQVWGTSRGQVEDPVSGVWQQIESLFAQASNWQLIPLGGPVENPYYVVSMLLKSWYSGQEEGTRTNRGELLYRGDLHYEIVLHGAISTT